MNRFPYVLALWLVATMSAAESPNNGMTPVYEVHPIGWVRMANGQTTIEVDRRYEPALLGLEDLAEIWVLYWFDRNDTAERRAILQVHPRGNPENPLRGVFATRAPVRPNLLAMSRCRVLSVQRGVVTIDGIDALPDTPVLDIKPFDPGGDR
jgi:tRNA (adenine37-N6)-methyltransferase